MKLTDLFWQDTLTTIEGEVSHETDTSLSRTLKWSYTNPKCPVAVYNEFRDDQEICVHYNQGVSVPLKYFPMTEAEVEANVRSLLLTCLSEECDVRSVRIPEMTAFLKEILRSDLTALLVDETYRDLDIGVPVIVLPPHTVAANRIVGVGSRHLGVISRNSQGVGLFACPSRIRSAYVR